MRLTLTPFRVLTVVILIIIALLLGGCETPPEETRAFWEQRVERVEGVQADLSAQAAAIQASLDELVIALAEVPDDDSTADKLRDEAANAAAVLADVRSKEAEVAAQVAAARQKLASIPADASSAEINAQMTGQAIQGVGAVLPPPWNAILLGVGTVIGGAGGLFGLIGKRKAQKAEAKAAESDQTLVENINAIEIAKRKNAKLREGFSEESGTIRGAMSVSTAETVNAIRSAVGKAA